jgi:hypothetical protein
MIGNAKVSAILEGLGPLVAELSDEIAKAKGALKAD